MTGKGSRSGLQGPDKQGEGLRDQGGGTYDAPPADGLRDNGSTPPENHQRMKHGADERDKKVADSEVPEGLRRELKGAYGKTRGRRT